MKQFIAVYASDSRGSVEAKSLIYKTVNTPDDAEAEAIERALKNTSNGPYTSFYKLIDLSELEQLSVKSVQGFEIVKEKVK